MKVFRIGIIGAGIIAESHLKAIKSMNNVKFISITDIVEEKARLLSDKYSANTYTDYKKMLANEHLDIVIINLPHYLHKQVALDCALAGSHILLEKPMAMNVEECELIIKGCREQNVKLMIGHVRHYRPEMLRAKQVIMDGSMGKLMMIEEVRCLNYFTDKRPAWFLKESTAGGGILMNLGSHFFDAVQDFTGSKVKTVRGVVGKYADKIEVEGNAHVFAVTENGVTASLILSGYNSSIVNGINLIFTHGMINIIPGVSIKLKYENEEFEEFYPENDDPFKHQLSDLIKSINDDLPTQTTGEYGQSIIHAIRSVYVSSTNNCEVTL